MPLLQPNQLFHNRYRLKRRLGDGGFSQVWLAEDTYVPGFQRALKIYQGLDDEGLDIFRREFVRAQELHHPYLLRPDGYDVTRDGVPFLIMRFCKRGSAEKLVGKVGEEQLAKLMAQIGSGLAYLHEPGIGIVHQDVKPDNFLVTEGEDFLLTDFGISRDVQQQIAQMHRTGYLRGSPIDLESIGRTPECYRGPEHHDARFNHRHPMTASDIWALGASLYELAAGDPPFGELGGRIQNPQTPVAPLPATRGFSRAFRQLLVKCLQYDPDQRPTADYL
ncbi:MAG: serine/threonine-protein kinase, partial [Bacteroidota bacterium]